MIKLQNITKIYKNSNKKIFENFNLEIEPNKITTILGPSGSGKTTLLNVIANITDFNGTISKCKTSYVFQENRLVDCLTIKQNLLLVSNNFDKIAELCKLFDVFSILETYPKNLSIGQKQRINLIRAILYESDLILFDEPFNSIDLKTKIKILNWLYAYQKKTKKTFLLVTHDLNDASYLSDRILYLNEGKINFDIKLKSEKFNYFNNNIKLIEKLINTKR